jgi:hypothetical protein
LAQIVFDGREKRDRNIYKIYIQGKKKGTRALKLVEAKGR